MKYMTDEQCPAQEEEQILPEECRALVERILESAHFRRASRSREFLSFVAEQVLRGDVSEIHEQEIGSRLFGRPPGYDTSQDNIVRVHATELRKRIEAYFASEGSGEDLVLEIPRGSYLPIFRRRLAPSMSVPSPQVASPIVNLGPVIASPQFPEKTTQNSGWSHWLFLPAVVALSIACMVLLYQNRVLRKSLYRWEGKPALTAFWPSFLNAAPQTDIVLADTSFALVEDIVAQSIPLNDYLNRSYTEISHAPDISLDRREDLALISSRNNGSFGDFRAASQIMALIPATGNFHLVFAREYSADAMKQHNVVLIGSRKSNPWVDLFRDRLNFNIFYDPRLHQDFVRNRSPRPGEQPVYVVTNDPYASRYSLIAFLPNPSNTAEALIIAGTDSEATEAAGEFLTSEKSLAQFRQKAHFDKFPYFEVLLSCTQLPGTSLKAEIVAWRTYSDLH